MPRRDTAVKWKSLGAVDLHFHGAFGIDLMRAETADLDRLSTDLAKRGVAAFCATTLSAPRTDLLAAVARLGAWIRRGRFPGARPLGIHLEGPFLASDACGAHPPRFLRPFSPVELDALWEASRHSIRILTLAPERIPHKQLKGLAAWAGARGVRLSLGHSRAEEGLARRAFDAGFSGVTHGWNALAFHHRAPGALGAALGRPDVHVELIVDRVHVAPAVMRWTLDLHPNVCFVSDCAPAAATRTGWHRFGPLKTRFSRGACRLPGGALAGGGVLLPEAYLAWLNAESDEAGRTPGQLLRATLPNLTTLPLRAVGVRPGNDWLQVEWRAHASGRNRVDLSVLYR